MAISAPGRSLPLRGPRFPAKRPTLGDLVPPIGPLANPWVRDAVLMLAASMLLAAVAQIELTVPFSGDYRTGQEVPITGQTFGVLLIGAALGSRRAPGAILLYLAWGWAGAPFFSGGASGYSVLFVGSTAGYLWGFVLAAFAVGWLAERGFDRGRWLIAAMLLGNVILYLAGLPVLRLWLDNSGLHTLSVWNAGLWPFIPGDLVKLIAASQAVAVAWLLVERYSPDRTRR